MKLLIDNNVIIDVFQDRKPFSEYSTKILKLIELGDFDGYITANSVTNIFYVLKRSINDYKKVYNYIRLLLEILTIIDVNSDDIFRALDAESNDFEDELISVCAYKANVDFIISRNSKDFKNQKSKRLNLKSFSINNFKKSFLQSPPSLWIVSFLGHQRIWEPFHGK